MNLERLIAQVKLNCDISDARYWGYYSICGLLLRLRELFRSEHSLMPWDSIPEKEIAEWISRKERSWEELASEDFHPIEIDGIVYEPFEVYEINSVIRRFGLVYGGGLGGLNKPTFFLARRLSESEKADYHVYYAGTELCRDLSAYVAMLQGRCIFLREERIIELLWEKFHELSGKRFGGALSDAFALYGIGGSEAGSQAMLHERIRDVSSDLSEIFLLHEAGEAYEDEQSDEWLGIIRFNKDRWTEFYLRGIKDLLADTSDIGPLREIIEKKKTRLLGFYIALMDGIRKELFPEVIAAFREVSEHEDWLQIEEARHKGYRRAKGLMRDIIALAARGESDKIRGYLEKRKKAGWEENSLIP
jgi:Family of unknown function (DUF6866) N-terminal domain/Family of unknown function (DUF6866) C-terminal domain